MTDTIAPTLTSLSFSSVIDVSGGAKPITFTATGTDDASGIGDLLIWLKKPINYSFSPSGDPSSFSLFIADGNYPDTWSDGQTATTFTISSFNAPGIYEIDHIDFKDQVGNTRVYTPGNLSAIGAPTSITVTGGHADTIAPTLTSLSFSSVIDVSGGAKPITFTATGTDDASGIGDLIIWLKKPINYSFSPTGDPSSFSLFIADGNYPDTWSDGQAATTFTISPFNAPGTYEIDHIDFKDHVGNTRVYTPGDLSAIGASTSIVVTGGHADTTAPTLTSLSFSSVIDVSGGAKPITFTATGTDDVSGIGDLLIWLKKPINYSFSPTGDPSSFSLFIANGNYPDTWSDGQTATTFTISSFNAPGTYEIDHIDFKDHVGNKRVYSPGDLSALGAPIFIAISDGAPVITSNGGGDSAAVSIAESTTAITNVIGVDPHAATLVFSIVGGNDASKFQINTSTGILSFIAAPDFEAPTDSDRNNSYIVQVRASSGSLFDDQVITVNVRDVEPSINGDTAVFSRNLSNYTLQDLGNKITVSGPDGSDTLFSIEHLRFADGTINANDGSGLFDTIFYDRNNLDVFHAGADAKSHYSTFGWHEGRDPDAFFSTKFYLGANQDVRAAGVNPLDQYHQSGWKEGRDPSPNFDTTLYLSNNPDVRAAGVDPLEHYLQFGQSEGRVAYAAIGQDVAGFDAEYYLIHNPDVLAAGADPLQHYNTFGWHEGRNPDAYFDTAGYLAHYADVAAAGVNPLQHYEQFGWKEGRDPSAGFDTLGYLAANPDVAAAHVNPLDHFLQFGIYEGRAAVNDGLWH
jgi:hypothetical protein